MVKNTLQPRMIKFANEILEIADSLPKTFAIRHLSEQLIRSGTSPALNYAEAQAAESQRDFVHKLNIALKELHETAVNLEIISQSGKCRNMSKLDQVLKENRELIAIFISSINTIKRKTVNGKLKTEN